MRRKILLKLILLKIGGKSTVIELPKMIGSFFHINGDYSLTVSLKYD